MFMGQYNHTIDAKGRVFVPAKFRETLGEQFVVTMGLDGCLFVYPNDQWEQFANQLKSLPGTKEARQLQRYFLAGAADLEVDKQGRILLPAVLREYAQLDKEVILAGTSKRIEIWNKERYLEDQKEYENNIDEIAANMEEFGFSI